MSAQPPSFPYTFFAPQIQAMLTGGATVGDKPPACRSSVFIAGAGAGVGQ